MDNKTIARFWSKVKVGEPNECWEWQAALSSCGYGMFWVPEKQQMVAASRVAWELEYGTIPDGDGYHGTCVMHVVCDNPKCCNATHMQLGSHAENMADMSNKNRCGSGNHGHFYYGESHHNAKLTDAQAEEIRQITGMSQRAIAAQYGVSQKTVILIRRNEIYTRSGLS